MKRYIDIHTHRKESSEEFFSLHNISPEDFIRLPDSEKNCFSAGIHPRCIDSTVEEKIKILRQIAPNPSILAIGETGLDKLCRVDFTLQKEIFNHQISIAKEVKKPLIIHCVKAYNEVQQLLKEARAEVPVIFHGEADLGRVLLGAVIGGLKERVTRKFGNKHDGNVLRQRGHRHDSHEHHDGHHCDQNLGDTFHD